MKIKFTLNQIGLAIDYFHDGEWRGLSLLKLKQPCMAQAVMDDWIKSVTKDGMDLKIEKEGF